MKLSVVAVGKVRDRSWRALADDYCGRLRRFVPTDVVEVRDARNSGPGEAPTVEGARILERLPQNARIVALHDGGRQRTSEDLARWMDQRSRQGQPLAFVIGGPYGLSDEVLSRAHEQLSLSSMTLPHEMARVVLLEQLSRAWTILRRLPYHHG